MVRHGATVFVVWDDGARVSVPSRLTEQPE
jgi:hypothetical protein